MVQRSCYAFSVSCFPPLIVLALLCILKTQSGYASECRALLDSGDIAYARYENEQALLHYALAREKCPQEYEPLFKKTRAIIDDGEDRGGTTERESMKRALAYSDTMLDLYPDSLQSWFLRAVAAANLARSIGGREKVRMARIVNSSAQKAISIDSTYAPSYVVMGGYYYEVASANSFLKAIAKLLYGKIPKGTLEDSERMHRKALELEPRNIYAHLELGRTLKAMRRNQEANEHFQLVLNLPITSHQDRNLKEQARKLISP